MSLTPGTSLGGFRLADPIGEGGMGVVWRATDLSLGRDVAIKVLPDLFASDPERLARFEREARLLASLNHPHVASIFGLHSAEGVRFLAMELVEGEDLAQRIARGPVPVAEVLPLALQIAQALEHAHEKGIIHRDLKPANVKLTGEGQAKVLDFGLAKALEGDVAPSGSSSMMSRSPTITANMTQANVLLGTAAYMAPEQARGQVVDKRADIWAFGVVLMEMLAGRRVFEGETISDTLASVLKTDPDWNALPAGIPRRLRALIERCLQRDPKKRLRDIGEARIALEEMLAGPIEEAEPAPAAAPAPGRRVPLAAWIGGSLAVGILATLGIASALRRSPPAAAPLLKFHVASPLTDGAPPASPVISPDGSMVAYLGQDRLWIQKLSELEPREYKVEPGATHAFWSPDSRHVAYLAGTRVLKVAVEGGESQAICDVRGAFSGGEGGAWREDGAVVFSRGDSAGLLEVPSRGGDPRSLLRPDSTETDLHEPFYLPGDRGVLFVGHRRKGGLNNLCLWAGGKRRVLLELPDQRIATPVYSTTGHILYARAPTTPGIWALPFSLSKLEVTGEAFMVAPSATGPSIARSGTLAYLSGSSVSAIQLAWVDRNGKETGIVGGPETRASWNPALSGNDAEVINSVSDGDNRDLWIYDTVRGTRTRATFAPGTEDSPVWSPSGDRIAYHASPKGCSGWDCWSCLVQASNGTSTPDTLARGAGPDFTPDGTRLVVTQFFDSGTRWDLVAVPIDGDRTPVTLVRGNPRVTDGVVAPGRDLMAYMSNESGEWEIFLTRFPSGEGRWQVSVAGGQWPTWNTNGDRLYFTQGDDVMEVEVGGGPAPVLGRPQRLFRKPSLGVGAFGWYSGFDVTHDGSRFVVPRNAGDDHNASGVTVVQNWFAEFADPK